MTEKDSIFLQKIRFLTSENTCFGELAGIAKEMAAQNLPVQVVSSDALLRKFFSETVSFCKNKKQGSLVSYSAGNNESDEKFLSEMKKLPENTVVLIDQIEKLSLDLQDDFLSFLENENKLLVLAGTSQNLEALSGSGTPCFSSKLAFRLGLLKVNVPSLNENKGGARTLAWVFLNEANSVSGKNVKGFSEAALALIEKHYWTGGAFELRSAVNYGVSVCETEYVSEGNLPLEKTAKVLSEESNELVFQSVSEDKSLKTALDSFKRYYVTKILEENDNNQTRAAKVLGLQRTYVSRLMSELNIR